MHTHFNGSFAMGSWDRIPRRKYHGQWISRALGRANPEHLLLDILERHKISETEQIPLVDFDFGHGPGTSGTALLQSFHADPFPRWIYRLNNGKAELTRSFRFFTEKDAEGIEFEYELSPKSSTVELSLEPLFTIRNIHSLSQENLALDGTIEKVEKPKRGNSTTYSFKPYDDLSSFHITLSCEHRMELLGSWYRNFYYSEEQSRGYPAKEDCFCPSRFFVTMVPGTKFFLRFIAVEEKKQNDSNHTRKRVSLSAPLPGQHSEFFHALSRSLNAYIYQDFKHPSFEGVIAGYPWFSAWARDTFISLPGVSLCWNDPKRAMHLLQSWAPNIEKQLFDKKSEALAVDLNCSGLDSPLLWGSALRFLLEEHPVKTPNSSLLARELLTTLERWLLLFFQGECSNVEITDFGFFCKRGNYATSWMDACVDGVPVTPRHGYPIDINALFFENMDFLLRYHTQSKAGASRLFKNYLDKVAKTYCQNLWVSERTFVGDGHDGLNLDASLRPNQLWALRSKFEMFSREQAIASLERITEELLTPIGFRSLAPCDSRYVGQYLGDQTRRDRAYHQGTVWPWPIGIYTEAALKYWDASKVKSTLAPVFAAIEKHYYEEGCIGQISEIFDGDQPHTPRGAPAQAWSVAETLRALWLIENLRS
ncbi:MAG: glycogen debranching enzyme N-terminal domain-containing protein [Bdellovibrio sp.]|nr:glycogen debranching enzyme N-terminal domain-containing protein [Bdellovibrio sp.]